MAAVEIGRFNSVVADIIIGRLQADGIAAFPLPSSGRYETGLTGILIDESEADAARAIIVASDADFPE